MSVVDPRQGPARLARRSIETRDAFDAQDGVVAVHSDFPAAKAAMHRMADADLDVGRHSIVWKAGASGGDASRTGGPSDLARFWEACGGLWSGLGDLPLGGVMVTVPRFGAVLIGGRLAVAIVRVSHDADVSSAAPSGLGALGAALGGLGLSDDDLLLCRQALEVGEVLVVRDGSEDEVDRPGKPLSHVAGRRASAHATADRAGRPTSRPTSTADHPVVDRVGPDDDATSQEFR